MDEVATVASALADAVAALLVGHYLSIKFINDSQSIYQHISRQNDTMGFGFL